MRSRTPAWAKKLESAWKPYGKKAPRSEKQQFQAIQAGLKTVLTERAKRLGERAAEGTPPVAGTWLEPKLFQLLLPNQPLDPELLELSPLFARSRELFLELGGEFSPGLLSTPRSLSSASLVSPRIEYSPIENELIWAATDPLASRNPRTLLQLRTYVVSSFHEQNHRSLWCLLPPPPTDGKKASIRKYLNFAESLIIATDMALGDSLGPTLARFFYLTGATYDPGTEVGSLKLSARQYRNYLQAAMHATYLSLELYAPKDVPRAIEALFPMLGEELARRAAHRALNLDHAFVGRTNLIWQKKHAETARQALSRAGEEPLSLGDSPMDNRLQYLWAERWFEAIGL